jgi:hypothetical protein
MAVLAVDGLTAEMALRDPDLFRRGDKADGGIC